MRYYGMVVFQWLLRQIFQKISWVNNSWQTGTSYMHISRWLWCVMILKNWLPPPTERNCMAFFFSLFVTDSLFKKYKIHGSIGQKTLPFQVFNFSKKPAKCTIQLWTKVDEVKLLKETNELKLTRQSLPLGQDLVGVADLKDEQNTLTSDPVKKQT